jgi:2-beta-glucuronyltransferase
MDRALPAQVANDRPIAKLVVLVTYHYWGSKRRAGFHGLAGGYRRLGWRVVMMTVSLSPLSALAGNYRAAAVPAGERNRLVWPEPDLGSFVWYTPFHPASLGHDWLDRLSSPVFALYPSLPLHGAADVLAAADLVVFESSCGIMLFDRVKRLNRTARLVYRVSDDMRWLKLHPLCQRSEARLAQRFDLISAPSPGILAKFRALPQAYFHPHGIDKPLFDADASNPYQPGIVNAVFVGAGNLDRAALAMAAAQFPDWRFHVIGPLDRLPARENIIAYGELPYEHTVRYLKFADIGLNFLEYRPFVEGITNFKVIQYSYCRLPVVTPDFLADPRHENFLTYRPGDPDSLRAALSAARLLDRRRIDTGWIPSWADIAGLLTGGDGAGP